MTKSPVKEERTVRRKRHGQFALETAEWLYIIDFSRNGLIAIDARGMIAFLNQTAARIIGTDEAHAVGKRVDKPIPNTGLLDTIKSGSSETNRRMAIGCHTVFSGRMVIKRGDRSPQRPAHLLSTGPVREGLSPALRERL